jgi:hypothetical protein
MTFHRVAALAALVLGAAAGPARAATLHVASTGTDSLACGPAGDPCRSISRAIDNAGVNDRIVVGPGRYGPDLNGNGILGEPGEEPGPVHVNKPLTLVSEAGAAATVIDAGGLPIPVLRIGIAGSRSGIGRPNEGFTFLNGGWGLATDNPFPGEATIAGNIAAGNLENGFLLESGATYVVTDNLAIKNGSGFLVHGGTAHAFKGNVAVANTVYGVRVNGGSGHVLAGNVAIGNGIGFTATGTGLTFRRNSALGNTSFGMGFFDGAVARLTQNNIHGNDPGSNCGLTTGSGASVDAADNFFGAASGPGPDPADDVCINPGSSAVFTPFAVKEFAVFTPWK